MTDPLNPTSIPATLERARRGDAVHAICDALLAERLDELARAVRRQQREDARR